ncbi:transposase [Erwinia tracheiphila]
MSASRLRHYGGGAVVHHYLDHRTGKHKRQTLSQEEMIGRYISHIPARHFKDGALLRLSGQPKAGHAAAEGLRSAGDDGTGKT